MKNLRAIAPVLFAMVFAGAARQADAIEFDTILPFPGDGSGAVFGVANDGTGNARTAILIDDVPVGFLDDEVWVYSMKLLEALQDAGFLPEATFGDYDFATGTGGLDALITTRSSGQDNQDIGPDGTTTFEEPTVNPANPSDQAHWWGQNDQDGDGIIDPTDDGPTTVGEVLDYLQQFDPDLNNPGFYLDLNQTGSQAAFGLAAALRIIDDVTGDIVDEFSLDYIDDGAFNCTTSTPSTCDAGAFAIAFGEVSFTGASGNIYSVNHNLGSGKPDYAAFVPGLDLSTYDPNDLFVIQMNFTGLNDGGEEIFMTGALGTVTQVSAPGTLILLSLGAIGVVVGVGGKRGRRKQPM